MAARAALEQGPHPHGLPEHHLLRARRVRDPAGRTRVLQEEREGADALGLGPAGGDPVRSLALRPGREPAQRRPPAAARALDDARPGEDHVASVLPRGQGRAAGSGRHPAAGHARPGAVLRELREGRPGRALRRGARIRRWSQGEDDHRHESPAEGARGDRERPPQPRRPSGGARRDRSTRRCGEGDVRRAQLPAQPVQPRRPGATATRVGVQAHRSCDRDERGHLARDRARVETRFDRRR